MIGDKVSFLYFVSFLVLVAILSLEYLSMENETSERKVPPANTIIGVYHSVNPSICSDVYPSSPDPRIVEVADLMNDLYRLLIKMRYIEEADVVFAPHATSKRINIHEMARWGFTKDVVDLLQMLPYKTTRHTN